MTLTSNRKLAIRGETNDGHMRFVLSMVRGTSPLGDFAWEGEKDRLCLPGFPGVAKVAIRLATAAGGESTSAASSAVRWSCD